MFAVSTFDAVGGLIIGAIGAFGLVVNDLFEQRRNRRNRMRGGVRCHPGLPQMRDRGRP